ncbi:MAG: U32 family peptidase, partial [Selenomonadaceae bacterium]|nr:U32 family peptidase [Selenomonadaceae bacterium]
MIELLAPVGSAEALRAAVNAGADAVYLAGKSFGARAFANNFSNDELAVAIKYAHLHGVDVHVTVNTIVADDEFAALDEYLLELGRLNVDALIIQDLGVAARARTLIPHIPRHASTQMTIHNIEGVRAAEELGFDRVVLARELSLNEIRSIVADTDIEIEVFVHGALCVCTSGQCLMSSMIGARSGNRGRCAQPCRLPYDLIADDGSTVDAGKYILSPKDLNGIDRLPALIDAGVSSLKIEGRMKRAEYVAIVVETYRRAIDRCLARPNEFEPTVEEHRRLAQIFNRDFTTAYLDGKIDRDMISDKKPNNRGLPVGRVTAVDARSVTLKATEEINLGDQIEIWIKVGGRINFTVEKIKRRGDLVTINVDNTKGIRVHDRAFKIFDAQLAAHAQTFFAEPSANKIFISAHVEVQPNKPLRLKLTDGDGNISEAETKTAAVAATNRPLD